MDRALASLAILKVEWDRGRDYIDCFVPFVADALRSLRTPEISIPQLQQDISARFHIALPQGALRTILNRASKHGFVSFHEGIILASEKRLQSVTLAKDSADTLRTVNALLLRLIRFADRQFGVRWSEDEAEGALLAYLQTGSIPILAASMEGTPLLPPPHEVSHARFIVNSFVATIQAADPAAFDALSTLVKGSMLANVLYYPELGQVARRFDNVAFFLDTSVLLRSMGLATTGEALARREMVDLLYRLNASIRCFEHTVREVRGVLSAAAAALTSPRSLRRSHGEAIEYFLSTGCTPSDVELYIARLDRFLRDIHVHIVPTPPHEESLGLGEEKFENILYDRVGYAREETLRHDLDAISAIHRLRRGQFPQDFETSVAVFVTDNHSLVRASSDYFRRDFGDKAIVVPHCLPYHLVTTLAWLKNPSLAPDLPRRLIIAHCYAALNPPDPLWRMYLQEIDALQGKGQITDEDYHLLRFSSEARALLMNKTMGDQAAFAEGTIAEVLEAAKRDIRRDTERKLKEERRRRKRSDRARYRALRSADQTRASVILRISSIAAVVSSLLARLLFGLGVLLQLALAAILFPRIQNQEVPIWRFAPSIAFLVTTSWSIYSASTGRSLRSLTRRLEVSVSRGITEVATRSLLPAPEEPLAAEGTKPPVDSANRSGT